MPSLDGSSQIRAQPVRAFKFCSLKIFALFLFRLRRNFEPTVFRARPTCSERSRRKTERLSITMPASVASRLPSTIAFSIAEIECELFRKRAPDEVLAGLASLMLWRSGLPEFIRLFLSDGLLPDLVYALSLKNA